ncbi:hypothetical protein, partial [Klebsiella pneumoniae]|uniref:hypothetical protein n=1 Tax=Klebsiella pneumoniae TaxID=573 RepID=UPI001C2090EA
MLVLLISSVCVVPCSLSVLRTRVLVLKITGYGSGAGLAMAGDKITSLSSTYPAFYLCCAALLYEKEIELIRLSIS